MVAILLTLVITDPVIHFSEGSQPLGRALAAISGLTGLRMRASDAYASRPVFLILNGVRASEFRARLAEAALARWQLDGDTLWLQPDGAAIRARNAARRELRVAGARESIRRIANVANFSTPFDLSRARQVSALVQGVTFRPTDGPERVPDNASAQRLARAQMEMPIGRLLAQAVAKVAPETWAELPAGRYTVFSTNPTRMQRPLPGMEAALASAASELKAWYTATEGLPQRHQELAAVVRVDSQAPVPAFGTLVAAPVDADGISVSWTIYNREGTSLGSASAFLDLTRKGEVSPAPAEATATPAKPVTLTPLAREYASAVVSRWTDQPKPPSPALLERLLFPERLDFLGLVPFEVVESAARRAGRNVIAFPSDALLTSGVTRPRQRGVPWSPSIELTSHDVDRVIAAHWRKTERSRFWILEPVPSMQSEATMPRPALGRFLRAVRQRNHLDIPLRIQLANLVPGDSASSALFLAGLVSGGSLTGRPESFALLRLYGSLTPDQRTAATSEDGLLLGRLSPQQRQQLEVLVYYRPVYGLSLAERPDRPLEEVQRFGRDAMREATYALGNGIPADGRLRIRERTDITGETEPVELTNGNRMPFSSPIAIAELAHAIETGERQFLEYQPKDLAGTKRVLNQLILTRSSQVEFIFNFGGDLELRQFIQDRETLKRNVPLAEMPAEFQSSYERWMRQLRDRSPGRPVTGGSRLPPPP